MRFILLDRITALEPPTRAAGVKCVSLSDELFADHFPGLPVFPGALILESMAQLGGTLLEATVRQRGFADLYALLVMAEGVRFRHVVVPGDRMELEALAGVASDLGGQVRCTARVGTRVVAEAELSFSLQPITHPRVIAHRRELLDVWFSPEPGATR